MLFRRVTTLTLAALLTAASLVAQTDSLLTLEVDEPDFDMTASVSLFDHMHPSMQLWGGTTSMYRDGISSLEDNMSFGLSLGTTKSRALKQSTQSTSMTGVYLWYAMSKDQPQPPVSHTADVWRFGFESDKGYGYTFGNNMAVNFYAGTSVLSWNVVNSRGLTNDSLQNLALQEFDGSLRFGASAQAGIGIQLTKGVELRGSYDWSQVYPRHLFWFWAGSGAIEAFADGAAEMFVKAVGKSSPIARPIMHFLLRNAVSMGFKGLRQHQMNWPFETVAPLNLQTWRISLAVTF